MTGYAELGCRHERAGIVDSRFHGHNYATPASRAIFCDTCRVQRWLDVEAALALSQGELGMIPEPAAKEIAANARLDRLDLDDLVAGVRRTGHSLVALLQALQAACGAEAGEYVHHGATTQDVQDTGQMLEMRDVLDEVDAGLAPVLDRLVALARDHRDTLMIARTHARPALPTTFGLKVAGWVDELLRQADRLRALRSRALVAELHGGAGTMAGFGDRGPELLAAFARRLGLGVPAVSWHVARDRVAEFTTTLAMLAATLARIADEVRTLGRPEFGEVEEGWSHGLIGSSTMPHKRNPEGCEQVVVLARLARAQAGLALDAMVLEHERDSRGLRLEWAAVADVSHHTLAALAILRPVLDGLRVHTDHMAAQARAAADAICSEALMLALGRRLGKQSAHHLVYELSQAAQERRAPLRDLLAASPEVRAHLDQAELDEVLDPARYLGAAGAMVDAVVAAAERRLADPGAR